MLMAELSPKFGSRRENSLRSPADLDDDDDDDGADDADNLVSPSYIPPPPPPPTPVGFPASLTLCLSVTVLSPAHGQ